MANTHAETKLLIPGLRSFYDCAIPFSWLVIRFAVGWNLLIHGWPKISGPSEAALKAYVDLGFTPPELWFWASCAIELVGGIAIILGLFTRIFASAVAIEMLIITITYWGNGFG